MGLGLRMTTVSRYKSLYDTSGIDRVVLSFGLVVPPADAVALAPASEFATADAVSLAPASEFAPADAVALAPEADASAAGLAADSRAVSGSSRNNSNSIFLFINIFHIAKYYIQVDILFDICFFIDLQ